MPGYAESHSAQSTRGVIWVDPGAGRCGSTLQTSGRICATTVAGLAGIWPDEDAQQRQTMQASDAYLGTSGDMSQVARPSDTLYGSEGWGFESLRARPGQRPIPIMEGAFLLNASANRSCPLLLTGCGRTGGCVRHVTYVVSPIAKFLRRCKGPPVAVCPTVPQVVGDHRAELLRGRGECDLRHMSTLGKRAFTDLPTAGWTGRTRKRQGATNA